MVDYDGLGLRLPLIMISPYAKEGYISHVQYEHGSILKFTEDLFGLPRLLEATPARTRRGRMHLTSTGRRGSFTRSPPRWVSSTSGISGATCGRPTRSSKSKTRGAIAYKDTGAAHSPWHPRTLSINLDTFGADLRQAVYQLVLDSDNNGDVESRAEGSLLICAGTSPREVDVRSAYSVRDIVSTRIDR